jgi:hypothetical protein
MLINERKVVLPISFSFSSKKNSVEIFKAGDGKVKKNIQLCGALFNNQGCP